MRNGRQIRQFLWSCEMDSNFLGYMYELIQRVRNKRFEILKNRMKHDYLNKKDTMSQKKLWHNILDFLPVTYEKLNVGD